MDPPHELARIDLARHRGGQRVELLPGETSLGQVSLAQLRPHHGIVAEVRSHARQRPAGRRRITFGFAREQLQLLRRGLGLVGHQHDFLDTVGQPAHRLQSQPDQFQQLPGVQCRGRGPDLFDVVAQTFEAKTDAYLRQGPRPFRQHPQQRMQQTFDDHHQARHVGFRVIEDLTLHRGG